MFFVIPRVKSGGFVRALRLAGGALLIGMGILATLSAGCGGDDNSNPVNEEPAVEDTGWVSDTSYTLDVDEPSGLAWDPTRCALWTVSDQTRRVYLVSLEGEKLRTLPWVGHDPEGIAYNDSLGMLYVVDEAAGSLTALDTNGVVQYEYSFTGVGEGGNDGLEGITCLPDSGKMLVLREDNWPTLYVVNSTGNIEILVNMRYADDISGADYDPTTGRLWVVSDQSKKVYWLTLEGTLVASWRIGISSGEGIVAIGDTLYIATDNTEKLYRYIYHPGIVAE